MPLTQLLSLSTIADELVGVESSAALVDRLDALLIHLHAVPARLYLYDATQNLFFPVAGFGCARTAPDLQPPLDGVFPPHRFPLLSGGSWVGMLELLGQLPPSDLAVRQLALLLGPLLISIHHRQVLHDEISVLRDEHERVVQAGGLLRHLDVDVLLVKILEMLLSTTQAEVGALLTTDSKGTLSLRTALGLRDDHLAALRMPDGQTLAMAVLTAGKALRLDDNGIREHLDLSHFTGHLHGLLALPITTRDRALGVAVLANPAATFDTRQQRLAETVCSMAAIALDNALLLQATIDRDRLQRELQLARSIQARMFPSTGLDLPTLTVNGLSHPCDETGGDYYTFIPRDGGAVAIIGDVTGHGLGAALFTTMAHALVQQQFHIGSDLSAAFHHLNLGLAHAQHGRFMTAAAVHITNEGRLHYASAGHNPLLWLHQGKVRWLPSQTIPLGIATDTVFPADDAGAMAPGDVLLLYTDGFTEAVDPTGEEFGEERLAALVQRFWHSEATADGLMQHILAEAHAWTRAPHRDDLTMVVLAWRGTAPATALPT
jgi:sigma-B regulation protein RsbU (phosphoserine phosphatase)